MRRMAIAVLILIGGVHCAAAQNTVRYFTNVTGLLEDLDTDVILKETRNGGKVVSAELDVCHAPAPNSPLRSRFVVALKPQGNRLAGSGQSQDGRTPVSVDLARSGTAGAIAFEGTIRYGERVFRAQSTDNADISAREFEEQAAVEETIVENPGEFREVTPGTVAMRVQHAALNEVLKTLRAERVKVQTYSIAPSCEALRRGTLDVQLDVDPERAADLVARARSLPGVLRAGWTSGGIDLTRALRLPVAAFRDAGGALDRDRLAKALAAVAEKVLNAQTDSVEWNDVTGELSLVMRRPDATLPGLDLVELIEIPVVASADRPGGKDSLVIRIGQLTSEMEDAAEGPRLSLSTNQSGNEAAEPAGGDALQAALAKELKAEIWDTGKEAWVRP
jgi:hypothetical protein